ncbi:MAG TPA: N-acyl homoserine lactonase family protein [Eubacteriales bacterium]|nr:N-acyl homoserine lactonase family protein [Eubacteriales bacterium]
MKASKLYVLYNGMLECDYANMVAMPFLGNSEEKRRPGAWVPSPVTLFLIEHPQGLVLFDTGCHPDAMSSRWDEGNRKRTPYTYTEDNLLLNQLRRLGYTPDDVDYVVLSHLHEDHAGGLEFFKRSELYVSDEELMQTLKLYALNGEMGGYIRGDIRAWLDAKLHWNTIAADEAEYPLLDGVKILNFGPGHAFGMLGLQVELEQSGTILLVADAVNLAANYGPPIRYPGLAYDTRGYEKTIRRIAQIQRRTNAKVFFGHDEQQLKSLRVWPAGCYE